MPRIRRMVVKGEDAVYHSLEQPHSPGLLHTQRQVLATVGVELRYLLDIEGVSSKRQVFSCLKMGIPGPSHEPAFTHYSFCFSYENSIFPAFLMISC